MRKLWGGGPAFGVQGTKRGIEGIGGCMLDRGLARVWTVGLRLLLVTCLQAGCALPGASAPASLSGTVSFGAVRHIQATPTEVGTAATVSLIDPSTSRTITTTLTQPDRSFSLSIPGFAPQVKTYYLEAVKGLGSNVAGRDAARLRTLVRWTGSGWQALTTGDASIGVSTTALSAIVGLRTTFTPVDADLLVGTLTLGTPDVFVDAGTGVSQAEFTSVSSLVDQALGDDRDPLEMLQYDGTAYRLRNTSNPAVRPFISRLAPNPVSAGGQLTVEGGNFHATVSENAVSLNGQPVTVLSGDSRSLLVLVPDGATSGPLSVTNTEGTGTASLTVTPAIEGGVLPSTTSVTPNAPGTDIPGSVFGR